MTALAEVTDALRSASDPHVWAARSVRETKAVCYLAARTRDVAMAVEAKAGAEAIHVRAMRERMPKDVQLLASTGVRLAERAIGLAIRAGQEAGEIRRQGDTRAVLPSPVDLAGTPELSDFYAMADDLSDDEFDEVLKAAIADQNTGRAHVLRKIDALRAGSPDHPEDWIPDPLDRSTEAAVRRRELVKEMAGRGLSSRQINQATGIGEPTIRRMAAEIGVEIAADRVVARTRRVDPARVAEDAVSGLDGIVTALELVNPADLTAGQRAELAEALAEPLKTLNRFARQIKE
jgi:hypothetical protein